MKRLIVCGAAALLAGCVSAQMNEGLNSLIGENIDVVVSRLGYPAEQRSFQGDTVYIWHSGQTVQMPMSTTSTTTGSVGGRPVYGTTTQTNYVPMEADCTIQIGAGPDGVIKTWHWEGNMIGCESYAGALRR